jgi:hypothetical protein
VNTRPLIDAALLALPCEAKRKLVTLGPRSHGTNAVWLAAVVVAAELRARGVPEAEALAIVKTPYANLTRKIERELEKAVPWAYNPLSGEPILTGCCRDPRTRTGNQVTGALRAAFEDYCDEDCARTCQMLAAIKNPSRSLYGTRWQSLDQSNLWMSGAKLGHCGHITFQIAALNAQASGEDEIPLTSHFLSMKSRGAYHPSTFGKVLTKFHKHGIITKARRGRRLVHARDAEWVAAKEAELGVAGKRESNIADARKRSDEYQNQLHEYLSANGHGTAVEDWTLPPPEKKEQKGPERPRFLRGWQGTIESKRRAA